MNNFVLHSRQAATATAAAFFLVGHATQAETPESTKDDRPHFRSSKVDGSQSSHRIVTHMVTNPMDHFASAASVAFHALAKDQKRLDPLIARQLADHAWDLYEEA